MRGEPVRFVGGMRYRARGGLFSGGPNLAWPLATLELRPDNIRVAPRWLACRLLPPVEIAFGDITAVETNFGITGGIRFRVNGPADGTVFWAMEARRPRSLTRFVVQALKSNKTFQDAALKPAPVFRNDA